MSDAEAITGTDAPDPLVSIAAQLATLDARLVSLERAPWADQLNALVASGAILATGDIVMHDAPTKAGCLLLDGSTPSRTTYADLNAYYAALGYPHGNGDGSTTFGLPDYRGRSPMGAGTGTGLTARVVGTPVGAETVTLTGQQSGIAAHAHTMAATTGSTTPGATGSAGAHSHNPSSGNFAVSGAGGSGSVPAGSTINSVTSTDTEPAHTHTSAAHTHTLPDTDTTGPTNAAQAHANVHPAQPTYFFVKT